MALKFQISKCSDVNESAEKKLNLQYIPAAIDGNCPMNITEFFDSYTEESPKGTYNNALRGHSIKGCEMEIPENYVGIVFNENEQRLCETADRDFRPMGTFQKFLYWNYDKDPSKADAFRRHFDIISLCETLCTEITEPSLTDCDEIDTKNGTSS